MAVGAGVRVGLSFLVFFGVLVIFSGAEAGAGAVSDGAGVDFLLPPKEILIFGVDVEAGVSRDGEGFEKFEVEPRRSFKEGF